MHCLFNLLQAVQGVKELYKFFSNFSIFEYNLRINDIYVIHPIILSTVAHERRMKSGSSPFGS